MICSALFLLLVGCIIADKNIASKGKARQVDNYSKHFGHAHLAIDGNTNGWCCSSVTHTKSQGTKAWWRLDFSKTYVVSKIRIWNRAGSTMWRLYGVQVTTDNKYLSTLNPWWSGNPIEIKVNREVTYITIFGKFSYLSLAEVEVFGHVKKKKKGLCGKTSDFLDKISNPPELVKGFVDFAFGTAWGVGDLKGVGASCKALGAYTNGLDYMYVQQKAPGDTKAGKIIMDRGEADKVNREKCLASGAENCSKKVSKMEKAGGALQKVNDKAFFPICMAFRPCAKDNLRFLKEISFGIWFGGNGVPIGTAGPFQFSFLGIIVSTSGDLLPATNLLLNKGGRKVLGMHVLIKGSVNFPITRKEKKIITVAAKIGIGVYGQMTLSNHQVVNSPSQLLEMLISNGADVDKFVHIVKTGKFRRYENDALRSLRSATLQVFGELNADITIHFKELLKTNKVGDLAITAKGQWQQEMHCDLKNMKNTRVAVWQSITAEIDLSQIFNLLGDFGKVLPSAKISMHYQHYMGIYFTPFRLDFQMVLGVSVHLQCKGLYDMINVIYKIINFVPSYVNTGSLKSDVKALESITKAICSGKHKLSVSISFNDGSIDAVETYIAYNSNKLRLSDLPTCPSVHGTPPGGKCIKNSDCRSDKGKYNDNGRAMKDGYCKNHGTFKTTLGCFGRCQKKLRGGHSCSKSDLNSPPWENLDVNSAEHAACQSGRCVCDTCTEVSSNKLRNGKKCKTDNQCESNNCDGEFMGLACSGTCRDKPKPKRCCVFGHCWNC